MMLHNDWYKTNRTTHSVEVDQNCGKHMLSAYLTNFGTLAHLEAIKT